MLSNARPTRFTYSEKQGGLVSLAFLELLDKVVLALTCRDIPDSATEPISWIGLCPIFVFIPRLEDLQTMICNMTT